MNKHTFNGIEYEIVERDGWYEITRQDGQSLGVSASFHGAVNAAVSNAFPREPRQSLRKRP